MFNCAQSVYPWMLTPLQMHRCAQHHRCQMQLLLLSAPLPISCTRSTCCHWQRRCRAPLWGSLPSAGPLSPAPGAAPILPRALIATSAHVLRPGPLHCHRMHQALRSVIGLYRDDWQMYLAIQVHPAHAQACPLCYLWVQRPPPLTGNIWPGVDATHWAQMGCAGQHEPCGSEVVQQALRSMRSDRALGLPDVIH